MPTMSIKECYVKSSVVILKQLHINKQKDDFSSDLQQNVSTKMRFYKVYVRIAVAVDKINKIADCRLSRLEENKVSFFE